MCIYVYIGRADKHCRLQLLQVCVHVRTCVRMGRWVPLKAQTRTRIWSPNISHPPCFFPYRSVSPPSPTFRSSIPPFQQPFHYFNFFSRVFHPPLAPLQK